MKRQIIFYLLLVAATAGAFHISTTAVASQLHPDLLKGYLRSGVAASFNMEYQKAHSLIQKAIELDADNPIGYAYMTMVHLMAYEGTFDEKGRQAQQQSVLSYADGAVSRGKQRLAALPKDAQSYMAIAMARLAKARCALYEKKYLDMFSETAGAWDYIKKSEEFDPQNYDCYFLMGLFRYHIDHLPGPTRFLSFCFITGGDRRLGLEELETAANKGDLLKAAALAELSNDYLQFEQQADKALPIIQELKRTFPGNFNFSFALGHTLAEVRHFDEAYAVAGEIERCIRSATPPYSSLLQSRYDYLMGNILFAQGDYARSKDYLQRVLTDTSPASGRVRAAALVRMGMISDIYQERKQACQYYTASLEIGGDGAAQVHAKKYLDTPYTPPDGQRIF